MWDQTLFKLTSERPSEVTGVRLPINSSHSTAFEGKRPSVRNQDRVTGSHINLKNGFLTCHIKDHLGLLNGDRHLIVGSCQNPWATSVIQHGHLGSRRPLPLWDWGQSLFQWPVRLQTGHGPGGSSDTLGSSSQLTCIWSKPLAGFTSRWMVKLPWHPRIVLRLQDMADSYGHQFSLRPGLAVFTLGFLFLLSLISIIKYPKGHLYELGIQGLWAELYLLDFPPNIRSELADKMLSQQGLIFGSGWINVIKFSKSLHKPSLKESWVLFFFLGHSFNLFIVNWLFDTLYHPF